MRFPQTVLAFCVLILAVQPSQAPAQELVWQTYAIGSQPDLNTEYWPKRDMALLHNRYPLITYLSENSTQMRAVRWINGTKSDIPVATLNGPPGRVDVEAFDDQASLIYIETYNGTGIRVRHTRFDGTQWSTPETAISRNDIGAVSLKLSPSGKPVILASIKDSPEQNAKAWIYEQDGATWKSTLIPLENVNISSFCIDPSGNKHVVYNPSSGGGSPALRYATDTSGTWTHQPLPPLSSVYGMTSAADGKLALLASIPGTTYSVDWVICRFDGTTWTGPEVIPVNDSPKNLTYAPDGSLRVLFSSTLGTLRNGTWTSQHAPELSERIIADDEGALHVLGGPETQIYYHCSAENRWQLSEITPADGQNYQLEGLVVDNQQRPVVIATDFDVFSKPAFTRSGTTWNRQNLNIDFYQPDFAIDSLGNLHAFTGPMYTSPTYAVGPIPSLTASVVTTASLGGYSSWDSLFVDSQNRPHVSFAIEADDNCDYFYAVKTSGTWQIEKVLTTERGYPQSAVTVTPAGTPYVFTRSGLYRKSGASWQLQFSTVEATYPFQKASLPAIVSGPDSTVHGLYIFQGSLYAFSGKDGNFTTERLVSSVSEDSSLVHTANGPVGAFVSYDRRTLRTVSKPPGGNWQTQIVAKIPTGPAFGPNAHIASAADGTLYLAASKEYILNSNWCGQLVLFQLNGPSPASFDQHGITQWKGNGGQFGFRARLQGPDESTPIQLQASTNLTTWSPAFNLRTGPMSPTANRRFLGNGFRTDLLLQSDSAVPHIYYRLARGSAILPE